MTPHDEEDGACIGAAIRSVGHDADEKGGLMMVIIQVFGNGRRDQRVDLPKIDDALSIRTWQFLMNGLGFGRDITGRERKMSKLWALWDFSRAPGGVF